MKGPKFAVLKPYEGGRIWTIDYYGSRRGQLFVLMRRWSGRSTPRVAARWARWLADHAGPSGWC